MRDDMRDIDRSVHDRGTCLWRVHTSDLNHHEAPGFLESIYSAWTYKVATTVISASHHRLYSSRMTLT